MLLEVVQTHFKYNVWATDKLLEYLDGVTDEQYFAHQGLCFRSIHGTLNHLILGNLVWHKRLCGITEGLDVVHSYWAPPRKLFAGPEDNSIYWEEFVPTREGVKAAIKESNDNLLKMVNELNELTLDTKSTFTDRNRNVIQVTLAKTLMHIANHGTHHRGQITAVLPKYSIFPSLDLAVYLRANVNSPLKPIQGDQTSFRAIIEQYCDYSVWATTTLLVDMRGLTDDQFNGHLGLCFRSIHGTLNHITIGNRIFKMLLTENMQQAGELFGYLERNDGYAKPDTKSVFWEDIYPTREECEKAVVDSCKDIAGLVAGLGESVNFDRITPMGGHFGLFMVHFINHTTHHRGQITGVTSRFGIVPTIDFFYYKREQ